MKTIIILLAATMSSSAYADQQTQSRVFIQSGRFQLTQLSDFRRDQFMIDTQTGRIWQSVCSSKSPSGDCSEIQWQETQVENLSKKPRSLPIHGVDEHALRKEYEQYVNKPGN